jgi:apolipoprotein N-acyltransferase
LRPDSAAGKALLAGYGSRIGDAAGRGARVVVLPEKVFDTDERNWPSLAGPVSGLARARHVDIVVGAVVRHGGVATNVAVAFPRDGGAPVTYTKHHLIPGLETDELTAGDGPPRRVPDGTRLGLIVCKDLDFPGLVREDRAAGASVLLAPAWDMGGDAWLHSRMAVTRGVESGLWVARAGRYGRLTISDPTGRVVAEADATAHPGAAVVADVATGTAPTLYARAGDWFGWLCAAALVALLAAAVPRRRRSPTPAAGQPAGPHAGDRAASAR